VKEPTAEMTRSPRVALLTAFVAGAVALSVATGDAHKPITSPYTYNEDVYPVLRERCAACHVHDGVAPMSLMTHEDTVPWGESIRVELLSGHMPPWRVDTAPGRFRNVRPMTAKEMNVVLTWATGGTPLGNPEKSPTPSAPASGWALGPPDLELPFPAEFTLPANVQEDTIDIVIPTRTTERRWVRAVDLLPGTRSIVRAATVRVNSTSSAAARAAAGEPLLALWVPGDETIALDEGAAFELPAGAELHVRVHYKKTWQYERKEMRDRSTVGVYFAPGPSATVRAIELAPSTPGVAASEHVSFSRTLDRDVQALAISPSDDIDNAGVVVTAIGPDGSRRELIAFHPRAGWARRYWFRQPIALARGTRLEATVAFDDEGALLPLSPTPSRTGNPDASAVRLTLDVLPAR
jgi:hypothetical protein